VTLHLISHTDPQSEASYRNVLWQDAARCGDTCMCQELAAVSGGPRMRGDTHSAGAPGVWGGAVRKASAAGQGCSGVRPVSREADSGVRPTLGAVRSRRPQNSRPA
jgi:hypothetical protein